MKKLMIAAAIVCAAACVQAAAFDWMVMGVTDIDGVNDYSGAAILTVWGDFSDASTVKTFNGSMTDGSIWTTVGDESSGTSIFVAGNSYDAQFTMTDTKGNVYTSEKVEGYEATYPSNNQFSFWDGSWQKKPEPTPEPTSALLMLVGVAGLALRRKQK